MLDSRTPVTAATLTLPAVLVTAVVALQIGYPLAPEAVRDRLTVAIVATAAVAGLVHAQRAAGRAAAVLLAVGALGFTVEVLGVHTGVPFGQYSYEPSLGFRVLGVPLLVGLAWIMMSWPAALVARRLVRGRIPRVLVGAWALACWDLFLDPQMVDAGHWRWTNPRPHLPGVDTVPLTNLAGWLLVSLVISAVLQGTCASRPRIADGPMIALYLWTYASSVLALGVFLGLPAAAGWGALGMGLTAVPMAVRWRRQ
jgi:uncharacterized membrane protein